MFMNTSRGFINEKNPVHYKLGNTGAYFSWLLGEVAGTSGIHFAIKKL